MQNTNLVGLICRNICAVLSAKCFLTSNQPAMFDEFFIPLFFLTIACACSVCTSGDFGILLETLVPSYGWIVASVCKQTYTLASRCLFKEYPLKSNIVLSSSHLFTLFFGLNSSFFLFFFGGSWALGIPLVVVWESCWIFSSLKTAKLARRSVRWQQLTNQYSGTNPESTPRCLEGIQVFNIIQLNNSIISNSLLPNQIW